MGEEVKEREKRVMFLNLDLGLGVKFIRFGVVWSSRALSLPGGSIASLTPRARHDLLYSSTRAHTSAVRYSTVR